MIYDDTEKAETQLSRKPPPGLESAGNSMKESQKAS